MHARDIASDQRELRSGAWEAFSTPREAAISTAHKGNTRNKLVKRKLDQLRRDIVRINVEFKTRDDRRAGVELC
jgi:hypothetical protein